MSNEKNWEDAEGKTSEKLNGELGERVECSTPPPPPRPTHTLYLKDSK